MGCRLGALSHCTSPSRLHNNSELYEIGGDPEYGFKRFSLQLGALTLPQPAAELDMSEIQAGRAFADYISAIGGDASSGNGGALASLSSWTKAPWPRASKTF